MSAFKRLFQKFRTTLTNPEYGWKTTHFWGPIANWGLVVAAVSDAVSQGPEVISMQMTGVLALYSGVFMRFAWMFYRGYKYQEERKKVQSSELSGIFGAESLPPKSSSEDFNPAFLATAASVMLTGALVGQPIRRALLKSRIPERLKHFADHPAGPFTIHGWAPVFKWILSISNILDYNRPVEKISLGQQLALCSTGFIWARYSLIITPRNVSLFLVNFTLGLTGLYHILRKVYIESQNKKNAKSLDDMINPSKLVIANPIGPQ